MGMLIVALALMSSQISVQGALTLHKPAGFAGNKLKVPISDAASSATTLRLRGGMFGLGTKQDLRGGEGEGEGEEAPKSQMPTPSLVDNSAREPGRLLRASSYSVLDNAKVTEPGIAATPITAGGEDAGNKINIKLDRSESQLFAQQAREQAETQVSRMSIARDCSDA